jgi:hypothetical protein
MKRLLTFLLGVLLVSAQQPKDHHSPFSLGDQGRQSNFATPESPSKLMDSIRSIEAGPVFPASPPDKFDFGRLSGFNEMHDSQIKDLQSRVRDIEKGLNWGQGVGAGLLILLGGIGLLVRSFWKKILRMLMEEAAGTIPPISAGQVSAPPQK